MDIQGVVLFLLVLLLVALVVEPLARRIRLPFSAALVIVGFLGSEWVVWMGGDTGIRWENFSDIIFYLLLPVLVFESAFNMDAGRLLRNLFPILFLAIPIMVLTAGMIAVPLYYGIGHPEGFPWIAALLTGALLSATDPSGCMALFKRMGVPKRLVVLMEGESLFNDATAIVLFAILLGVATMPGDGPSTLTAVYAFLIVFFGGAFLGVAIAVLAALIARFLDGAVQRGVLSLASAYAAFLGAEHLHVSGVMAVLMAGLVLGAVLRADREEAPLMAGLWRFNAYVADSALFLITGVTVTLAMFADRWIAILIAIGAVLLSRVLGVFGIVPLLGRLPGVKPIDRRYQAVMVWGGLRGAVTLALALSIPAELDYWYTIQSVAYGVVIWTLFVQAPSMASMLRRLGLSEKPRDGAHP
ncbi:MAG: cation:proton antiporter [Gammaproteobacteria bacterium]